MKILGVDCSSSCSAASLVVDGEFEANELWRPLKNVQAADKLLNYYDWIGIVIARFRPQRVVVSTTSFSRSHQTTRVLARYESATIIQARQFGAEVIEAKDSEARKIVLGKGNLTKQEAYETVVNDILPNYAWLPFKAGGDDQVDSFVFAMAGNELEIS